MLILHEPSGPRSVSDCAAALVSVQAGKKSSSLSSAIQSVMRVFSHDDGVYQLLAGVLSLVLG